MAHNGQGCLDCSSSSGLPVTYFPPILFSEEPDGEDDEDDSDVCLLQDVADSEAIFLRLALSPLLDRI